MKFFADKIRMKANVEPAAEGTVLRQHSHNDGLYHGTENEFAKFDNQFDAPVGTFHSTHDANAFNHAGGGSPTDLGFTPHPKSGHLQAPAKLMSAYADSSNSALPSDAPAPPKHVSEVKPKLTPRMRKFLAEISKKGGRAYYTGGAVRDHLEGKKNKDIDIEAHGLEFPTLENIAKNHGNVNTVGQSFGVTKLNFPQDGHEKEDEIDLSLPRRDNKTGEGHKGFQVEYDPHMGTQEASKRRDFTHGAMLMDPLTGEVTDHYGGMQDMKDKVLRHVDDKSFDEDPLRMLRAMQIASRRGETLHPSTAAKGPKLSQEYGTLSEDRVMSEWQKMAEKGIEPSKGLQVLKDSGWDKHYPELQKSMTPAKIATMDQMAKSFQDNDFSPEDKHALFFAALTGDMSPQDSASFMNRVKMPSPIRKRVAALNRGLTSPHLANHDPTDANIRNISAQIGPDESMDNMMHVLRARNGGMLPSTHEGYHSRAKELGVHQSPPKPMIDGEVLKSLGMQPGPEFGRTLREIYQHQIDGTITSPEQAIQYVKSKS